jgi:hypothetical protein
MLVIEIHRQKEARLILQDIIYQITTSSVGFRNPFISRHFQTAVALFFSIFEHNHHSFFQKLPAKPIILGAFCALPKPPR